MSDWLDKIIGADEFGLLDAPPKKVSRTAEDRLASSFMEIVDFVREHGREPARNMSDPTEFRLAARLAAIAGNEEQRKGLADLDEFDLLREPEPPASIDELLESDALGLLDTSGDATGDIFTLEHVPTVREVTAADHIARREPCSDFDSFKTLFDQCHAELRLGTRTLVPFRYPKEIRKEGFFLLNGLLAYVAEEGEREYDDAKRIRARLRVIFENGTESRMLLQSLSANLYKNGRRVTEPNATTLARMGLPEGADYGTVYVLRSLSEDPQVQGIPDMYKIGSTGQTVDSRVAGANAHPTFLNAPVEVVAEYHVPGGGEKKVEHILHTLFAAARLDIWFEQKGRNVAEAREWFSVPLDVVDQAIQLISSGAIVNYEFDAAERRLVLASS